jgi:hypothetical protein
MTLFLSVPLVSAPTQGDGTLKNSTLTNHDCFADAFIERVNREFTTAQIRKILLERYPNFSLGSVLPNDHAKGNKGDCPCVGTARQIFEQVRRGVYRVRQYRR